MESMNQFEMFLDPPRKKKFHESMLCNYVSGLLSINCQFTGLLRTVIDFAPASWLALTIPCTAIYEVPLFFKRVGLTKPSYMYLRMAVY